MPESRLSVLGRFSFELGQVAAPSLATQKARSLLAYLVTHRQSDVGRERLLEVLWPESDPERAKSGLRTALWSIRRAIREAGFEPDDYLSANRSVIRWHASTELDAETFTALARGEEPQQLERSLALYKGDFLEGDYEEWVVAERARLSTAYESVLSRLVRSTRNPEAAQLLLGLNPYDEPSYIVLIEAELSAGRVVAAEALGERCERALAEVGAKPSKALLDLFSGVSSCHIQSTPKLVLPFVGREVELARVRDALIDQSANKSVLLISGEAGIGKSAFLSHASNIGRSLGRVVVNVACVEDALRPYGPFQDLYADMCEETSVSLPTDGTVDAVSSLTESITSGLDADAFVLVDDAHTLAGDALRILSALTRRLFSRGHAIVIATRSEGRQLITSELASCRVENMTLGPLRAEEVREAIDAMVVDSQEKIATAVFERSGGHPLFAKALIDSMAQSGLLRPDKGMWRLAGTLDDRVALPTSLTSYIQTRLRTRGETATAVAAALALEPHATADDITVVIELSESKVFDAIDDLLALGVVAQPASGPELAFTHDLYREVAAATLNVGRRARLHRSFARRFAESQSTNAMARCAQHLSQAGDALNAAEAWYQAALHAFESGAWAESRERCHAGIVCLEKIERAPQSDTLLAGFKLLSSRAHAALGDPSSAIASAGEAMTISRRSGQAHTALQAALARQRALLDEYDATAVLAGAQETVAMARDAHDDISLAIALADRSCAHRLLADEIGAIDSADEAEQAAESAGDADSVCYALEQQILTYVTWWRFSAALKAADRSERAIISASVPARAAIKLALASLNLSLGFQDLVATALASCDALLQKDNERTGRVFTHRPLGTARSELCLNALAARLALDRGQFDEALNSALELERLKVARAKTLSDLFQADVKFESGVRNSATSYETLSAAYSTGLFAQDVCSGSRSPVLAGALAAINDKSPDVASQLTRALNAVEAASRRTPLDTDRAFAQLAHAAEIAGQPRIAERARLRRDFYIELRAVARSGVVAGRTLESTAR